jgi:mannitol/fructose-specific phosphotransferase system IIA component (Ntr-type)
MSLMASFRPECIQVGSTARDKIEVLQEIAAVAKRSAVLSAFSEEQIFQALQAREKIGSTGFSNGIAIPHCSLENLPEFVVGVLIAPQGVGFDSFDDKPTRAFFFIIGPRSRRDSHIQLLSGISKILKKPRIIDRFLEARDPRMVKSIIAEFFNLIHFEEEEGQKGKCLFHVFVQREEYFQDILQTFSAAVQGSVAVVEAARAGFYLHANPLFAAYTGGNARTFSRLITAVVDKDLSNEVIRRIHMIVDRIDEEPGVLLTVQEIFYSSGSLEF